ncbi:MAG TPA: HAMP domain-containing sensor histidine kinase, partial [Clostridiales bacterium]|nr:HAMP domain-containing sensor histidine kinase [Clostridiales bacterium]
MKLFLSYQKAYWKEKRSGLLLFLLCVLLFSGIFYLYRLPLRAVYYPALLCLLLIFAFLLLSFRKWKKKQTDLDTLVQNLIAEEEQTLKKVNLAIEQEMPKADTLQEEAYQQLIAHLQEQLSIQEAVSEAKRQDMTDYYTLWVHQIKTPLASMQLSLQNEDSALSRKLTAELYRTEQYVEMALAYLRLQVGSTDYLFKRISLDALLQNSVRRFSTEFITKKLRLNYVPTEKDLVTDEKWLGFVIEQLLSNALKYTNHG